MLSSVLYCSSKLPHFVFSYFYETLLSYGLGVYFSIFDFFKIIVSWIKTKNKIYICLNYTWEYLQILNQKRLLHKLIKN